VVLRNRLVLAVNAVKQRHRQNVESLSRRLRSVGPEEVLRRGYSLTTDSSGRLVRRIASVPPGAIVRTRVADGVFESEVIASNAGQMDLFQPTQ